MSITRLFILCVISLIKVIVNESFAKINFSNSYNISLLGRITKLLINSLPKRFSSTSILNKGMNKLYAIISNIFYHKTTRFIYQQCFIKMFMIELNQASDRSCEWLLMKIQELKYLQY